MMSVSHWGMFPATVKIGNCEMRLVNGPRYRVEYKTPIFEYDGQAWVRSYDSKYLHG